MANAGLHEPIELLDEVTVDRHRALVSLREEFRSDRLVRPTVHASNDSSLAELLAHNRDEEKEHATMTLEWIRRRDPELDRHLRTYMFTTEPVTVVKTKTESGSTGGVPGGPLRIVSLRGLSDERSSPRACSHFDCSLGADRVGGEKSPDHHVAFRGPWSMSLRPGVVRR